MKDAMEDNNTNSPKKQKQDHYDDKLSIKLHEKDSNDQKNDKDADIDALYGDLTTVVTKNNYSGDDNHQSKYGKESKTNSFLVVSGKIENEHQQSLLKNERLEKENKILRDENETLKRNIGTLYRTAMAEIERWKNRRT